MARDPRLTRREAPKPAHSPAGKPLVSDHIWNQIKGGYRGSIRERTTKITHNNKPYESISKATNHWSHGTEAIILVSLFPGQNFRANREQEDPMIHPKIKEEISRGSFRWRLPLPLPPRGFPSSLPPSPRGRQDRVYPANRVSTFSHQPEAASTQP